MMTRIRALVVVFGIFASAGLCRAGTEPVTYESPAPGIHRWFGAGVALDGDIAGVLVPRGWTAMVYCFDVATGAVVSEFNPPGVTVEAWQSPRLEVSGGVGIFGAPEDDRAFLFDVSTGSLIREFTPPGGSSNDPGFGDEVAVSPSVFAVSARSNFPGGNGAGAVYFYETTTGDRITKAWASDRAGGDSFGSSIAISGTTTIVGAPHNDDQGTSSGAAYVFDGSTGTELLKLLPDDGAGGAGFGNAVDIDGDLAVIAAPGATAAYVFDVSTGEQIAKLTPYGNHHGGFGASVSISDGLIAVGAPGGSVYVYDATGLALGELRLDLSALSFFGTSVSISGNRVLVGAPGYDGKFENSGLAALFTVPTSCSPIDLAPPLDVINFFDIATMIQLYLASDTRADLAEPFGTFNFMDIAQMITFYNSGCP